MTSEQEAKVLYWLKAAYMEEPFPRAFDLSPDEVGVRMVLIPMREFTGHLMTEGMDPGLVLDACREKKWVEDMASRGDDGETVRLLGIRHDIAFAKVEALADSNIVYQAGERAYQHTGISIEGRIEAERDKESEPTPDAPPKAQPAAPAYGTAKAAVLLALLAHRGQLMTATDINAACKPSVTGTSVELRTITRVLGPAIEDGLISRPKGPKGGCCLTPMGIMVAEKIKPIV